MKTEALDILYQYNHISGFKLALAKECKLNPSTITNGMKRKSLSAPVANLILQKYKKVLQKLGQCKKEV